MTHDYPLGGSAFVPRPSLTLLALLFGLGSYCILSLRAELAPEAAAGVLSLRRMVATAGGAVLFWAILRRLDLSPRALRSGPLGILGMLLAAGTGLLALRVLFGKLVVEEGVPLAQDVRWTILWVGYLGLSTGLYLAYRLRTATPANEILRAPAVAAAPLRQAVPDLAIAADWLAEAVVAELGAGNIRDRRDLAQRLIARAGYQLADPLDAAVNDRVEVIERVAARLNR